MPLVVLPAQVPDIKAINDIYFTAFEDVPVMRFLFPSGVNRDEYDMATQHTWEHDPSTYPIKCVDTSTGEIIGMATWQLFWKHGEEHSWKKPSGVDWLQGEERETSEKVLMPIFEMRDQLFGRRRHVYLPTTAVHPDHQKRGAGRLLMQWGIDIAEKLELPLYLETSEDVAPFYEKMGCERLTDVKVIQTAEVTGAPGDVEVPLLVKMPSKAKGLSFQDWVDKGCPEGY
ncbi:acyl-CoA N-acyltransferase [Hypomontagnella submonticulosa]|nr:acyl-CoA N-acyltransferase [Hypomontagnella submonticulosa]